jgi:hypothetical protein
MKQHLQQMVGHSTSLARGRPRRRQRLPERIREDLLLHAERVWNGEASEVAFFRVGDEPKLRVSGEVTVITLDERPPEASV